MTGAAGEPEPLEREVEHLFLVVREALAGATDALLGGEPAEASRIVAADESFDELCNQLSRRIWERVELLMPDSDEVRRLVCLLLMVPELERSADLAEHIAQRAVADLGPRMSPVSRGVVQRMSEVALGMWSEVSDGYVRRATMGNALDEEDEELDILHDRLTREVAASGMAPPVAAQITLVGRFYERLGDHAVNVARRVELLPQQERRT